MASFLKNSSARADTKIRVYPLLIFHFPRLDIMLEAMKYKIANLNSRLNLQPRNFFRYLTKRIMDLDLDPFPMSPEIGSTRSFKIWRQNIRAFRAATSGSKELELLEMQFFYLKGRYPIFGRTVRGRGRQHHLGHRDLQRLVAAWTTPWQGINS